MSPLHLLFIVLLLFPLGCSSPSETEAEEAAASHQVILPASSELSYTRKPENPAYFSFTGELALDGIVLAYWDTQYLEEESTTLAEAEPVKTLQLRFYPSADARSEMPSFVLPEGAVTEVKRVFLYRDLEQGENFDHIEWEYQPDEAAVIGDILSIFEDVPDGFLRYREGFVFQPVDIVLEGMVSFIEGDHRFFYAKAQTMESSPHGDDEDQQIPDTRSDTYLGRPWVETFYVEKDIVLREQPTHDSDTVALLEGGTHNIEKVKTVDDEWIRVRVENHEKQELLTGYVEASELMVIN